MSLFFHIFRSPSVGSLDLYYDGFGSYQLPSNSNNNNNNESILQSAIHNEDDSRQLAHSSKVFLCIFTYLWNICSLLPYYVLTAFFLPSFKFDFMALLGYWNRLISVLAFQKSQYLRNYQSI